MGQIENPAPELNDCYCLVVERDTYDSRDDDQPIVFEQYLDGFNGSLEAVKAHQKTLGKRYGRSRIARLEFLEDWK